MNTPEPGMSFPPSEEDFDPDKAFAEILGSAPEEDFDPDKAFAEILGSAAAALSASSDILDWAEVDRRSSLTDVVRLFYSPKTGLMKVVATEISSRKKREALVSPSNAGDALNHTYLYLGEESAEG
jgi:hypothetical protein